MKRFLLRLLLGAFLLQILHLQPAEAGCGLFACYKISFRELLSKLHIRRDRKSKKPKKDHHRHDHKPETEEEKKKRKEKKPRRDRGEPCIVKMPGDIPKNEPVYFRELRDRSHRLFVPKGKESPIENNKGLYLLCPGKGNLIANTNSNEALIRCKDNQFDGSIADSNCAKQVVGSLQWTNESCGGPGGIKGKVGFEVKEKFVVLFEVCYNTGTAAAFYAFHTLHGRAIVNSVKQRERIDFIAEGINPQANLKNNFKKAAQVSRYNAILGPNQAFFNIKGSFLARGHLAPDADFIFPSGQFSTYYYANTHPQFQDVNAGNWLRIESLVRKMAGAFDVDLHIYTGVHGRLKLPKADGSLVEMFLSDNGLVEVPEWTWKVVLLRDLDSAIVFISINNPYATKANTHPFCPDICAANGYDEKGNFANYSKGFSFCCDLNEFKKVVKTLPSDVRAGKVLANPVKEGGKSTPKKAGSPSRATPPAKSGSPSRPTTP